MGGFRTSAFDVSEQQPQREGKRICHYASESVAVSNYSTRI